MNVLDRAHVQAAGGLHRHDQRKIAVNLAGDDGLLLVAAGHAAGHGDRALTGAHVVLLNQALGILANLVEADEAAPLEAGLIILLQHHVLLQGVIQDQAVLVAVLRDVAHARRAARADGGVGDVPAAERHAARGNLFKTRQRVNQLGLAVAVDARDAQDLALARGKAHVLDGVLLVQLAGDVQVLHLQHRLGGMGLALLHLQLHRTADHHAAQLGLAGVLGLHGAHVPALAQHGHAVGDLHDLVELVGDEQDALALLGEAAHDFHQLLDLLGGEHGGGLVEDQHLVVAVEHLQYLHALLHAHGDVLDLRVEIHLQAVSLGKLLHLAPRLLLLEEAQLRVLRAEDDVVQHREHVDQFEVLVHHADVQRGGVVGIVDLNLFAVLLDDSGLGLIEAEEDAHQRRFSGAVLAEQGMDLALAQLQCDVVVRLDAGELLGDVKHFDYILGRVVHAVTSLSVGSRSARVHIYIASLYCFPSQIARYLGRKSINIFFPQGSARGCQKEARPPP